MINPALFTGLQVKDLCDFLDTDTEDADELERVKAHFARVYCAREGLLSLPLSEPLIRRIIDAVHQEVVAAAFDCIGTKGTA